MPPSTTSVVHIEPATEPAEFPVLAEIFDTALRQVDSVHELFSRYGPQSLYQSSISILQKGLEDQEGYPAFKAVETVKDDDGNILREMIIGMACWHVGYISIAKVDPFADTAQGEGGKGVVALELPDVAVAGDGDSARTGEQLKEPKRDEHGEEDRASQVKPSAFDFYDMILKPVSNAYIENIRGKKHIHLRRLAVLPEYQGRGAATKLVQWGALKADEEGLVGWLNARQAGLSVYKRARWQVVRELEMPSPGLQVTPMLCMLRQPMEKSR